MKSINLKRTIIFASFIIAMLAMYSFAVLQKPKAWETPAKYKTMKATKSTPESVASGKALYAKHCKSCHGTKGAGDGAKAAMLKTTINSFSTPEYKKLSDGEKYYRSFVGRDEMPNFEKKIIEEEERWAIIHYINTL